MKIRYAAIWVLVAALTFSGCGPGSEAEVSLNPSAGIISTEKPATTAVPGSKKDMFTDRDSRTEYTEADSALIQLTGNSAQCSSDAVSVSGSIVTILDEGTYIVRGTLENGMIIVNSDDMDKTQLVLDGVKIHCETSASIYISGSDKVFITLAAGSENTLSNGGVFTNIDENNIDAVIFSKADLALNGTGCLTIESPAGHGIVCKDDLVITGGNYTVNAASHGIEANDSIRVAAGSFAITSGKDGFHAENTEDTSFGYVYIAGGSMDITSEGDGISAGAWLAVEDGDFDILTGGGSVNASNQTSDNWGGFMGGMGSMGGRPGGNGGRGPDDRPGGPEPTEETSEDSTSIKGIKAAGDLHIFGGTFSIDSADDAIHSNGNMSIEGGIFDISTGDDGFHADADMIVKAGTITVSKSYEGIEGLTVTIAGGDIGLHCSDDGLNAAGGMDGSGMGGFRGGDMFGVSSDSYITISGGTLYINAGGDGVDSNGELLISGGDIVISGPVRGDTAVLDYGSTGTITGGTFVGTGALQMAVTFSHSQQGVISVSVGSQSAGTVITLSDKAGNLIMEHTADQDFAIVILSCPQLVIGEEYNLKVGEASGTFAAN